MHFLFACCRCTITVFIASVQCTNTRRPTQRRDISSQTLCSACWTTTTNVSRSHSPSSLVTLVYSRSTLSTSLARHLIPCSTPRSHPRPLCPSLLRLPCDLGFAAIPDSHPPLLTHAQENSLPCFELTRVRISTQACTASNGGVMYVGRKQDVGVLILG